jgi:tetratricopeptide (TPR) repeat protein
MKSANQVPECQASETPRDRRRRSLPPPAWFAVVALLALPQRVTADPPGQKAQPPTAPVAVPETLEPGTVAVDLTRAHDPDAFRPNVTRGQRIHVHLDLGRVFESRGNHEAALLEYQQALAACERWGIDRTSSTDIALVHRRIGGSLDRLGRFALAEVHYKQALRLCPRDPKIWNDAGYSYYLQGRWADAERTLKTGARLAPDDARISTNLGLTLAAAGRTREALTLLSRYSGDAIGHANLGYLLAATGQVELARQQYLQALALRPNLALAHRALAQLDRAGQVQSVARVPRGNQRQPAPATDRAVLKAASTTTRTSPPGELLVAPPPLPSLTSP